MHPFKNHCPTHRLPWIIGGIILAIGFAFLFGFFVMLLWNWLMPAIFGLGVITYWQAWGLVLLAHILFKAGHGHPHGHKHDDYWRDKFKKNMKERFAEPQSHSDQEETQN